MCGSALIDKACRPGLAETSLASVDADEHKNVRVMTFCLPTLDSGEL